MIIARTYHFRMEFPMPPTRPGRLPGEVGARARVAAADSTFTPAPTRDAATVVLLRERPRGGIEVFLIRRVRSMAFAGGMYVFPGGSVDPRDARLPESAWAGPPPGHWAGVLAADDALTRALVAAAVRETFEESGVLLAGAGPDTVAADTTDPSWEADRQRLLDRSLPLAELLTNRGLRLRADLLRPWAHWITPEVEERRYDTRFFLAAIPTGQRARDVGGESDLVAWVTPEEALARVASGEWGMLRPTAVTLTELCGHRSVAAALTAADARDVRPVLPRVVVSGADEVRLLLPGDAGYDG